jgi:hypothetical protein
VAPNIHGSSEGSVSCLPSGNYNIEVAPKFFKNLCTPAYIYTWDSQSSSLQVSQPKSHIHFSSPQMCHFTCPSHHPSFYHPNTFVEQYKPWSPSVCSLLQSPVTTSATSTYVPPLTWEVTCKTTTNVTVLHTVYSYETWKQNIINWMETSFPKYNLIFNLIMKGILNWWCLSKIPEVFSNNLFANLMFVWPCIVDNIK